MFKKIFFVLIGVILFSLTTTPAKAAVTVTSPEAGSTWAKGSIQTVTWTGLASGTRSAVTARLYFSDYTQNFLLADRVPLDADQQVNGQKQLRVSVPTNIPSRSYRVQLTFHQGAMAGGENYASPVFNIVDESAGPNPIGWQNPPAGTPPDCNDVNTIGCNPPINVSIRPQFKTGPLTVGSLTSLLGLRVTADSPYALAPNLLLGVNGRVGATEYCDKDGANCIAAGTFGASTGVGYSKVWFNGTNNDASRTANTLYLSGSNGISLSRTAGDFDGDGDSEEGLNISGGGSPSTNGGTVTSVTAGSGLLGGTITSAGTISLNTSNLTNCINTGGGDKIVWDATNGKLTCAQDRTGSGGGYDRIMDSGVPLAQRSTLKFYGTGITCTDNTSTGYTECNVPGGNVTTTYGADESSLTKNASNQFSIKDSGVTSSKIENGTILGLDIYPNTITGDKIANSAFSFYTGSPNANGAYKSENIGAHKACFVNRVYEKNNWTQLVNCSATTAPQATAADAANSTWYLETQGVDSCRVVCFN